MKTAACVAALVVGFGSSVSGAVVATSADLDFVVGEGSNLSVLIIDFQQGPESSFAWGYRWDGTASGEDLLAAVTAADSNFSVDSTSFSELCQLISMGQLISLEYPTLDPGLFLGVTI